MGFLHGHHEASGSLGCVRGGMKFEQIGLSLSEGIGPCRQAAARNGLIR
jgi:hypothetical protein